MAFVNVNISRPVINRSSSSFTQQNYATCTVKSPVKHINHQPFRLHVRASADGKNKRDGSVIRGRVFVVGNNIDTDQIIPAEYLTLVPSNLDEYTKLGTFAMDGLPAEEYPTRYVSTGALKTEYPIIVAGDNFGCGSSREHAPVAIGAAGGCAVVAKSYARIFFRNCSATGELYPWELDDSLTTEEFVKGFATGHHATINFDNYEIKNDETGQVFKLKPLGDVLPVIDAGGIFEYARQSGMIAEK